MEEEPRWGLNSENPVILENEDFSNPTRLWENKIPKWWARQKELKSLPEEESMGWPFAWFASWEPNEFQRPTALKIQEALSVAEWYFDMLIDDEQKLIKVGDLSLSISERQGEPRMLITMTLPDPETDFDPITQEHAGRECLPIFLSYDAMPSLETIMGDLILHPFLPKIDPEAWQETPAHTPWNQVDLFSESERAR